MSVRNALLVAGLSLALLVCPFGADAHIKNEETQYPDIDSSPARFDIVLLAAAGIVPETPLFEPDRAFRRKDLASWLALGKGIAEDGENPDVEALARVAVAAGLIESLEGDASLADIDRLFFYGQTNSEGLTAMPTKGEAARYLASRLTDEIMSRRGLTEGPTGIVTNVAAQPTDDGDSVYILTIGHAAYPMYAHGRVARGPTDLLAWEGRAIARSFVRTINGRTMWTYLEAAPLEARQAQSTAPTQVEETASGNSTLLYGLIAAVVLLAAGLFFRGRRAG